MMTMLMLLAIAFVPIIWLSTKNEQKFIAFERIIIYRSRWIGVCASETFRLVSIGNFFVFVIIVIRSFHTRCYLVTVEPVVKRNTCSGS